MASSEVLQVETKPQPDAILRAENLVKRFAGSRPGTFLTAVNNVSFTLKPGEILGMVGESGSGKSTVGRTVLKLLNPTSGRVIFEGKDISTLSEKQCRPLRSDMQMVFQDPWMALNPRMKIRTLIEEPLLLHSKLSGAERRKEAESIARQVHLTGAVLDRFPNELSGGQLQRVCVARALATSPKLIVLDEPTSSLDLSVRAGIIELLAEIRQRTGAAMLFISHDIGTLKLLCDTVAVLYLGAIVEYGPTDEVFSSPRHPYTKALMSAHLPTDPSVKVQRQVLTGEVPSPIDLPPGCSFAGRCPVVMPSCRQIEPKLKAKVGFNRKVACLRESDMPLIG